MPGLTNLFSFAKNTPVAVLADRGCAVLLQRLNSAISAGEDSHEVVAMAAPRPRPYGPHLCNYPIGLLVLLGVSVLVLSQELGVA